MKDLLPEDHLTLDFETCSTVDLKKTGVSVYARHPDTKVLCMGYAFRDDPIHVWNATDGSPFPKDVLVHAAKSWPIVAHNSTFERYIWNHTLTKTLLQQNAVRNVPTLDATQLVDDTMIRVAYWGLPLGLNEAALALGLPFGKDLAGRRTMLKMSKPRGNDPATGENLWWHDRGSDPQGVLMKTLMDYCATDVSLERLISKLVPRIPLQERKYFILDQKMNDCGLRIDTTRVQWFQRVASQEISRLDKDMGRVTDGFVPTCNAVGKLKTWLDVEFNLQPESLSKGDLTDLLDKEGLPARAETALLLRQEAAKTSTAKLNSMLNAADEHDDRVRNVFQFYGAGRTGRYAGRLIQPQNYPRPSLKRDELETFLEDTVDENSPAKLDLGMISSALRSCIIASPGKSLIVVDFAQIEARILAWLAGQKDILTVFARGEDVYTYAANKIGSSNRLLGKVCTLGLGYGMGPDRFVETAKTYGLTLASGFATSTVSAWRASNNWIAALWRETENALRRAFGHRERWHKVQAPCEIYAGCFLHKETGHLLMLVKLPSGRLLVYREPQWDTYEGFSYMGVDQYTKQWTRIRSYGAKVVENYTQAVARDLMLHVMETADTLTVNADLIGTVHDEGIWETDTLLGPGVLDFISDIIRNKPPVWANGLPLGGEGFVSKRYGKG